MTRGDYAKASQQASYSGIERPHGACFIDGCPLPGSLTASTSGTNDWTCRLHFGAPSAMRAMITQGSIERFDLLRTAHRLAVRAPGDSIPHEALQAVAVEGRPELLEGQTTCQAAARHMFGILEREIKTPQQQPPIAPAFDGDDPWN